MVTVKIKLTVINTHESYNVTSEYKKTIEKFGKIDLSTIVLEYFNTNVQEKDKVLKEKR